MSDHVGQNVSRPCPYCDGDGCSECDGTGRKVTTYLDVDGAPMRVSGSADLSPEAAEALTALGRAAMNLIGGPDSPGPKGPRKTKARSGAERPNPDPASGPLARPPESTSRGRRGWIWFRFGRWMLAIWPLRPEVLIDRFNYPAWGVLVSRSEKPISTATEKGMQR